MQTWLLNVTLPDKYQVSLAHAYFVVCLFVHVSVFPSVCVVEQTCSPLQAELLTWVTTPPVSSVALHFMQQAPCCPVLF